MLIQNIKLFGRKSQIKTNNFFVNAKYSVLKKLKNVTIFNKIFFNFRNGCNRRSPALLQSQRLLSNLRNQIGRRQGPYLRHPLHSGRFNRLKTGRFVDDLNFVYCTTGVIYLVLFIGVLGNFSKRGAKHLFGIFIKFRQLRLPNLIVDDSDSKPSEFKCRFWSNSKSHHKIVLCQIISITFRLKLIYF